MIWIKKIEFDERKKLSDENKIDKLSGMQTKAYKEYEHQEWIPFRSWLKIKFNDLVYAKNKRMEQQTDHRGGAPVSRREPSYDP